MGHAIDGGRVPGPKVVRVFGLLRVEMLEYREECLKKVLIRTVIVGVGDGGGRHDTGVTRVRS